MYAEWHGTRHRDSAAWSGAAIRDVGGAKNRTALATILAGIRRWAADRDNSVGEPGLAGLPIYWISRIRTRQRPDPEWPVTDLVALSHVAAT